LLDSLLQEAQGLDLGLNQLQRPKGGKHQKKQTDSTWTFAAE